MEDGERDFGFFEELMELEVFHDETLEIDECELVGD